MKIVRYLKPYWYLAILSPLFMFLEVAGDLVQPTLMSQIVDQGVLGGSMQVILSTGLRMLLFTLGGALAGVLGNAFGSAAAMNFGNDLRGDVFSRVMHLSPQQTDRFTTGSLVTRLTNDITATQDLVSMSLRMFVRVPFQFIGGIIMALSLDIQFGIVLVCALPVQLLLLWLFIAKTSPLFGLVQKKLDRVNAVVQENVGGARVVKAYVREDYESARFGDANDDLMQHTLRVQKLMALLNPLMMVVMNLSVVAVIFIGGLQVQAQQMQVGQIMAAITYITQILMALMMASMMMQNIAHARASAQRIREVLDAEPVLKDGGKPVEKGAGSVCFDHVSFHYPDAAGRPVLQDINLEIRPGEMVAVLGATGSGKTSLVGLIPRFYDCVDGQVLVDGVPVQDYDLHELRSRVGYVLQKSELFSGTILDNIRWGNDDATEEEAIWAAKIAQADEFIQKFQEGYHTPVGEKGMSLSGGQKQRLAIARAILKKPEILIFDDSTSALDLSTEARLRRALRENLRDTTVVMIAQRVASVQDADRIAVLENGRIAACGPHEQLLTQSAVYRDIYDSQIREEGRRDA